MNGRALRCALGFARRQLVRALKSPPLLLPPLLFPLMLFGAFAGGLSALGRVPTFTYPDYTTFQFVWILMVAMALCGFATGLAMAQDFESGFAKRILLATTSRVPIVVGYVLSSVVRAVAVGALLLGVGLVAGMEVSGNAVELAGVVALALLFNLLVTFWAIGVALRAKSMQAAPLMQTPVFIALFLVPVYTTRELLAGWIQAAADVNPLTPAVEAVRGLIVGAPERVPLAFGLALGLTALTAVFALTGLKGLDRPARARRGRRRKRPRARRAASGA